MSIFAFDASLPSPYVRDYTSYLLEFHLQEIRQVLSETDSTKHFSVSVDFLLLLDANISLAHLSIGFADQMLLFFDEALLDSQREVYAISETAEKAAMSLKLNCHVRIYNLHLGSEATKSSISSLRSSDVLHYVCITGTVIRTGVVKMLESEREYECQKCKHRFRVYSELQNNNTITLPKFCSDAGSGKKCSSTTYAYVEGSRVCRDYQELKVQEQVQKLTMGAIPRSILVVLQDDLVDQLRQCLAGDDVVLCGILRHIWRPECEKEPARCELELILEARHVRANQESKSSAVVSAEQRQAFEAFWVQRRDCTLGARDLIIRSICPQLFGLYMVKLAVALTLIGGVAQVSPSGTRIRGESHLLLVGDPGTGKSQLLRYAAKISSRAVMTTGIGTTSAGLTVSVVKDTGGDWALEAGALVLADGGLCCIDEFDSIRLADRATIHEAMEQQTLSVAKAGLVATLNTRATVFAALNPKGPFDESADMSINTAIASPLLSRFDMILLLLDNRDEEWDKCVASHILESLDYFGAASRSHSDAVVASAPVPEWFTLEKMQAYVTHVKQSLKPRFLPASEQILIRYYALQRRGDDRNAARTTIRLLESLVRLAQAHARLMFRTVVLVQDAILAVYLLECSMYTTSLLGLKSIMHSQAPDDPDASFINQAEHVLRQLRLSTRILENEPRYPYERMQYNSASKLYELVDFDIDEAFPLNLPTSSTNPQVETLDDIIEEEECVRQAFDFLTQGI